MKNVKALKVIIGLQGHSAKFPKFNQLAAVQAAGIDWSYYVDAEGSGWITDKKSGHKDDDAQSPRGQQIGVLLVPEDFANQAVAAFPDVCEIVTKAQLKSFYENRVTYEDDDDEVDDDRLHKLLDQMALLKDLDEAGVAPAKLKTRINNLRQKIVKALDPDDDEPGVKVNKRKALADYLEARGFNVS